MNRFLLGIALGTSLHAAAQTPATGRDYSDLWYNAQESGWGVNVIQQDTILFVTLFVYGADRRPTWYVGPAVAFSGASGGGETYSGDLFTTTGPPLGTPFDPNAVVATAVGNFTFRGNADGTASISYTVNGTPVSKDVVRQTWRANAIAATQYYGATSYTRSGCSNPSMNGPQNDRATYTLTITSATFTLFEDNGPEGACSWNGSYTQGGRLGSVSGTVQCEGDPAPIPFTMTDLQVSSQGFSANWTAQEPAPRMCRASGRIGGTRR
jgi:hypothetical protein